MRVYPVNALPAFYPVSDDIQAYARITDIYNNYIEYTVDFVGSNILITGNALDDAPLVNSIIIGNISGADYGHFKGYAANGDLLIDNDFKLGDIEKQGDYLNIIHFLDASQRLKDDLFIRTFELNIKLFNGSMSDIKIGYLYIGACWELPRFGMEPIEGLRLMGEGAERTSSGQAIGVPVEPLRSFSTVYTALKNEEKKLMDNYTQAVQTIVPHVIDPYPKAHEKLFPFFATIEAYGEKTKRDSQFRWDFDISWLEAR